MVLEVRANVEATVSAVASSPAILKPSEQGGFFQFLEILFKITFPWSRCLLFNGLLGVMQAPRGLSFDSVCVGLTMGSAVTCRTSWGRANGVKW